MIRRLEICNPKLLVLVFSSALMTGCADQTGEEARSTPITLQETNWNSTISGKTSGPIQFRYRLEEHDGRLFKLRIFARSAIGGLEGWNIDLMESGLKLADGTTALSKANGADSSTAVSRQFAFRDEASDFDAVAVKVEVVIGNQLASKTFKVKLGPDSESAVEICESGTSCERALPAKLQ